MPHTRVKGGQGRAQNGLRYRPARLSDIRRLAGRLLEGRTCRDETPGSGWTSLPLRCLERGRRASKADDGVDKERHCRVRSGPAGNAARGRPRQLGPGANQRPLRSSLIACTTEGRREADSVERRHQDRMRPRHARRSSETATDGPQPEDEKSMMTANELNEIHQAELEVLAASAGAIRHMLAETRRRPPGTWTPDRPAWVWSDLHLHLHHRNIIRYTKRPFTSCEMDGVLHGNWRHVVGEEDVMLCCGDIALAGGWGASPTRWSWRATRRRAPRRGGRSIQTRRRATPRRSRSPPGACGS